MQEPTESSASSPPGKHPSQAHSIFNVNNLGQMFCGQVTICLQTCQSLDLVSFPTFSAGHSLSCAVSTSFSARSLFITQTMTGHWFTLAVSLSRATHQHVRSLLITGRVRCRVIPAHCCGRAWVDIIDLFSINRCSCSSNEQHLPRGVFRWCRCGSG